jgi:sodium/bile acid cotransporter 7
MRALAKNWFLAGAAVVITLAFLFPGAGNALNPASRTSTLAVVLLFFLSGLNLPSESIRLSARRVRLHLYIQIFIFVVAPLYFGLTSFPFREILEGRIIVGIYALACLPTTITSCTVFTQLAGGNAALTMLNASLSNTVGILLSPLLLSLLLREAGQALPMQEVARILFSLLVKMLVPVTCGQLLRRLLGSRAAAWRSGISQASNVLMLSIIYFAFCRSAGSSLFRENLILLLPIFAYLAGSYLLLLGLAYTGARLFAFEPENTIAVLFAAPQKTLAMGIPLITTYFAAAPEYLGLAILPILFYHPWQLLVSSILGNSRLVTRLAAAAEASPSAETPGSASTPGGQPR